MINLEDVTNIQCNRSGCDEPFEIEPAGPGYPDPDITVPVECTKGKFCSQACRARAMYEAQDDAGKKVLRRYYLGAQLIGDNHREAKAIVEDWDIDLAAKDAAEDDLTAISPDGGTRGVLGPEDDACDSFLMDKEARAIIWRGLYAGRTAELHRLTGYEMRLAEHPGDAFWQKELDAAQKRLTDADAALKTLERLGKVCD